MKIIEEGKYMTPSALVYPVQTTQYKNNTTSLKKYAAYIYSSHIYRSWHISLQLVNVAEFYTGLFWTSCLIALSEMM
jgi:hypothetical protein